LRGVNTLKRGVPEARGWQRRGPGSFPFGIIALAAALDEASRMTVEATRSGSIWPCCFETTALKCIPTAPKLCVANGFGALAQWVATSRNRAEKVSKAGASAFWLANFIR
jgi:hypothetical protein